MAKPDLQSPPKPASGRGEGLYSRRGAIVGGLAAAASPFWRAPTAEGDALVIVNGWVLRREDLG